MKSVPTRVSGKTAGASNGTAAPLTIVWFRQDLRLDDNPALTHAVELGAVLPVFIDTSEYQSAWLPGEAARWWLGQSLSSLDEALRARNSRLSIAKGDAADTLLALARETGAQTVVWNRRYEPTASAHDEVLKEKLRSSGLEARSYNGRLLREPWEVRTGAGGCYKVFTPYWRRAKEVAVADPLPVPQVLVGPRDWPRSLAIEDLPATSVPQQSANRLAKHWQPGERGAEVLMRRLDSAFVQQYSTGRDIPAHDGTSRLSPHLHFGEIGACRLQAVLRETERGDANGDVGAGVEAILRQLAWRDFTYNLIHHFPATPDEPLRGEFSRVEWRDDAEGLRAWADGRTGYPIVDAGMRQLKETGWMHNRVRMIVASFLTKDLFIHWREGAAVFWDLLVDADLANNTFGWQWAAGCGADAAPYFRIFNPVTQAKRFDADGIYVRKWVPELAGVPSKFLHDPWNAPAAVLCEAGLTLGRNYPQPIVDHRAARERALAAFEVVKSKNNRAKG